VAWAGDSRRAGSKCALSVHGIYMTIVMGSGPVRAEVGREVWGTSQGSGGGRWGNSRDAHTLACVHLDSLDCLLALKKARFGDVRWQPSVGPGGAGLGR
jgi:hypothetical protein